MPDGEGFTSGEFRKALGSFATGVTVVTTCGESDAYGMTANAFSSVSLDPPLVLVCVKSSAVGREYITTNGVFAINILASDQEALSRYFSSKTRPRGPHAFAEVAHCNATSGSPILEHVAGYLDCRLRATHHAGDHHIIIGEVIDLGFASDLEPLLFHAGRYRYVQADA